MKNNKPQLHISLSKEHEKNLSDVKDAFNGFDVHYAGGLMRFSEMEMAMQVIVSVGGWVVSNLAWDFIKLGIERVYQKFPRAHVTIRDDGGVMYTVKSDLSIFVVVIPDRTKEFEYIKTIDDLAAHLQNKAEEDAASEWKKVRLGDLYDITSSKRVFQHEWTSEGVPFYRAREIVKLSENGFVKNTLFISRKMFEIYKSKYGVPQAGDLLITGVGTIGIVYRVVDNTEFYFKDGNIIWFKTRNLVSSAFIEQLYKSPEIRNRLLGSSPITTVATYTIDAAKKSIVYLPPIPEQKRIVSVLETWDRAIEKLVRKIEVKKNIKKGLMQNLLTGKVRLSGFSDKWLSGILGDFLERIEGGGTPSKENASFWNGNIPWASVKDVVTHNPYDTQDHISEDGLKNSSSRLVTKGTLIVPTRMALGHAVVFNVDVAINQDLKAVYPKNVLDNEYLYHWFKSKKQFIARLGSGSTVSGIQLSELKSIKLSLPTLLEQAAIAKILTTADEEIETLQKKLAVLKEQKKYLLNNLITGQIRTPETLRSNL